MEFINKDKDFNKFVNTVLINKENPPFLFVGAGVSIASDLPNWTKFINKCISNSFGSTITSNDLAKLHQVDSGSTWLIDAAIKHAENKHKDKLSKYDLLFKSIWEPKSDIITPTQVHYLIVKYAKVMNVPILTTNYDNLLELAAEELGYSPTIHSNKSIRKNSNLNKFCIVYIHGRIPKDKKKGKKSKEAVASNISYLEEFNKTTDQIKEFKKLLTQKSCIFIGCSMTDDNINRCLLDTVSNNQNHYFFTKLKASNSFEKEVHYKLWQHLNLTPIYCQNNSFYEIPTAFRRALTSISTQPSPLNHFTEDAKNYNYFTDLFGDISTGDETLLCIGPYDQIEIDLYLDCTEESDNNLQLRRVWSSNHSYTEFKNKPPRSFSIPIDPKSEFYTKEQNNNRVLVEESMDSLSSHKFIRKSDFASTSYKSSSGNDLAPPRSWSFVSFPVFSPVTSRAAAIFVLKFVNKNNTLANQKHIEKRFNSEITYDIIKLGKIFTERFTGLKN